MRGVRPMKTLAMALAAAICLAPQSKAQEIDLLDPNVDIAGMLLNSLMIELHSLQPYRDPEFGTVRFMTGATDDPLRARIKAGGQVSGECGQDFFWFNQKPDLVVDYWGDHGLRVIAVSQEPTALLVMPVDGDTYGVLANCVVTANLNGEHFAVAPEQTRRTKYAVFLGAPRKDYNPRADIVTTERDLRFLADPNWRNTVTVFGSGRRSSGNASQPRQNNEGASGGQSKPYVIGVETPRANPPAPSNDGAQSNPIVITMGGDSESTDSGEQKKPFVISMAGSSDAAEPKPENLLEPPLEGTLCTGEDRVIFSGVSEVSSKVVSVCLSYGDDENPNHLTYRYGKPGAVELKYPSGAAGSQDAFMLRSYVRAGVSLVKFEFRNGGYDYAILDTAADGEEDLELRVTRLSDGKVVSLQPLKRQSDEISLLELEGMVPTAPFDE